MNRKIYYFNNNKKKINNTTEKICNGSLKKNYLYGPRIFYFFDII